MKCDETKPKCWQCARLNRECIYILNPKNKKRKSKASDGRANSSNDQSARSLNEEAEMVSNFGFSFSDANLLYHNLNDLVNWRLEEALTPVLKSYIEESSEPFNTALDESQYLPNTADLNEIVFNNPLSNFNIGQPHIRYLTRFYNEFCDLVCPFVPNVGSNPFRDVLLHYAKRETYLMYAILACGAQSLHQSNRSIQDDQAYCSYLSSCLNILSDCFEDESFTSGNIEPMLLTILLLTSDCASSKNLRWRAHLKGAKELLKKTTLQSDTLNFCKNWLITYEVLAGITNPFGGILQSDEHELDEFITNDELYLISLKRLNMLDINGFNYLAGHMTKLDLVFRDIINVQNRIRKAKLNHEIVKDKSHLEPEVKLKLVSFEEVNQILYKLTECEEMFVIDKSGIITESNLNHPSHNSLVKNFKNIETVGSSGGNPITYSWFDVSHQGHIIAARLITLTKLMEIPNTSPLVQDIVKKGLAFLDFVNVIDIDTYENKCPTHLHVMIDVLGRCCIYETDQLQTEKYLKLLKKLGLASADHNLQKLQRIWNNDFISDNEEDILTW